MHPVIRSLGKSWMCLLLVIPSVVALVFVIVWRQRPESFESAATTIVEAIESGDGATLAQYMDVQEKKLTGANPESLTAFLQDFYGPRMRGFTKGDPETMETSESATHYVKHYVHRDGRRNGVLLRLNRKGKDVVCYPMLGSLVDTAFRAELPANKPFPIQRDKLVALRAAYARNKEALIATKLKGICCTNPNVLTAQTWEQLVPHIEASIARFDAREARANATSIEPSTR